MNVVDPDELNKHVIRFHSDLRKAFHLQEILDTIDLMQNEFESSCTFGSMIRVAYRLKGPNDSWIIPN